MRSLFRQEGANLSVDIVTDPDVQRFISAHADLLDSSFSQVDMSDSMRRHLQQSDYIFSGMKTFHELNEAFPSLIDENGIRKPFEQFLNDVQKIDNTYNRNYLRAEYNFAHASAQMAARWEQFAADGDRYNLQYRTANDGSVRPEHAALHGVTLPPSDPFWQSYFPPNGWNCRCTAVQVLKDKYPETPHDEAEKRAANALSRDHRGMFRFNPGIQRKTFPDYNPYTISRCRDCDIAKGKLSLAKVPENEICAACILNRQCEIQRFVVEKRFDNGGSIAVHHLIDTNASDYNKIMDIANHFASLGNEVRLTPKMSRPQKFVYQNIYGSLMGTKYEGKCPDLWVNGIWYEHEGFTSNNPKRAFSNMMNHGLKQSSRIIIDKPLLTDAYMKRNINQRIKDGQIIDEVWIKDEYGISLFYKKV